jgi:hypothetical protein
MIEQELIPRLIRTEYRKITAVLTKLFGLAHIEIAEDIVSDTFYFAKFIALIFDIYAGKPATLPY